MAATTALMILAAIVLLQAASFMKMNRKSNNQTKNTYVFSNDIDCSGDYLTARALIMQHLIEPWDKERWQKELENLERIAGADKEHKENEDVEKEPVQAE